MATIALARIDFRIIHGQVITKWLGFCGADRIVVANDELAADEFLADIYRMSAPSGTSVEVLTLEDTVAQWKQDELGSGKILLIVKTAHDALRLVDLGFELESLNVGNLGGGNDRKEASSEITYAQEDVAPLEQIALRGVEVYAQMLPNNPRIPIEKDIASVSFS